MNTKKADVEKEMESVRMICVGLGNAVFDLIEKERIDMRKEVTEYFAKRFEKPEGR